MITSQEKEYIKSSIDLVVELFRNTPNVFLTEDDLRMHICSKLLSDFGREENTNDGDVSISLHSEVRWYGDGTLKTRSDIVVVDVSTLDVLHHSSLPSKGYGFNIPKAIIELKFRRPKGDSEPSFIKKIMQDLDKLDELKEIFCQASGANTTEFWMIVFDKKKEITDLRSRVKTPEDINFMYEFSNTNNLVI